ncbi:hypothetical protein KFE98_14955 [bacterium SCSIO 12741]|nr:hypothetical protein KFE98_14955 [bacterium SCSIO 12741]
MKPLILLLLLLGLGDVAFAQEDTVFIRQNRDWTADTLVYETDTLIFPSGMARHILSGTTVLPSTHGQIHAKGYGLYLKEVSRSACKSHGEEVYWSKDKINSVQRTDTSITVDLTIYDNCCYDFLCDIEIDEERGGLILAYQGYGSHCACDCCFGLTFHIGDWNIPDLKEIKGVMIKGEEKSFRKLE